MIRSRFGFAGIELDSELNLKHADGAEGSISTKSSRIAVYVMPTNEELLMARETERIVESPK
jgi:acetate kinase